MRVVKLTHVVASTYYGRKFALMLSSEKHSTGVNFYVTFEGRALYTIFARVDKEPSYNCEGTDTPPLSTGTEIEGMIIEALRNSVTLIKDHARKMDAQRREEDIERGKLFYLYSTSECAMSNVVESLERGVL